jgi:integrase
LTHDETQALLAVTVGHLRDHLVFSFALGTGLRLSEIVGLDVGDVFFPTGQPRTRVRVRAEIAKGGRVGDVFLPDALVAKLQGFWRHKLERRERIDPAAPLFCALSRRRLSPRRVQILFHYWQDVAGFGRSYPFHSLRHTAVTGVYRASRDLFLAQRFARHASPLTTVIYTHASDDDLRDGVRNLVC